MKTCLTVELSPRSSLKRRLVDSSTKASFISVEQNDHQSTSRSSDDHDAGSESSSSNNDEDSTFIIHANRISLSHAVVPQKVDQEGSSYFLHPYAAAVFVSSTITESALDDFQDVKMAAKTSNKDSSSSSSNSTLSGRITSAVSAALTTASRQNKEQEHSDDEDFALSDPDTRRRLSTRLLSLVHPFLARNFTVKGIISQNALLDKEQHNNSQNKLHAPSDIILLDLSHAPEPAIDDMLQATNCQLIHSGPEAILKVLLISQLIFKVSNSSASGTCSESGKRPASNGADTSNIPLDQLQLPHRSHWDIPTCPVCLHRIDPRRLGLPRPENHQLCSKFCPPPNYSGFPDYHRSEHDSHGHHHHHRVLSDSSSSGATSSSLPCAQQRLLQPWPSPSYCIACRVIDKYWKADSGEGSSSHHSAGHAASAGSSGMSNDSTSHQGDMFCFQCPLQETLWVCLTCGFVGCGRYSNKHAAHHFVDTGHPYSLELATLRIWDYVSGDFAHRTDLLDCPSSPPLMHPWMMRTRSNRNSSSSLVYNNLHEPGRPTTMGGEGHHVNNTDDRKPAAATGRAPWGEGGQSSNSMASSAQHLLHAAYNDSMVESIAGGGFGGAAGESKSPKKATMIGEEYEALLQSALEEQAQHYEGEITHLRARLTAEHVDQSTMTVDEEQEIETLRAEIASVRSEIDRVSRELLDSQAQEAGHRAKSQRLLREQQVVQELLQKIRTETEKEHEEGKIQVEELEQQIADLTANQRMRDQFSQDEELQQAQIWGMSEQQSKTNKRNKSRRFFRK